MNYDISIPPPTRQELEAEKFQLTSLKKQQIKASIISDSCHGLCFVALYLNHLLSGIGLSLAIILATFVAFALAISSKKNYSSTGFAAIVLTAITTMLVVAGMSIWVLEESFLGGTLSGLTAGSIVAAGAVIGRKFFHVFLGLDSLKNVAEDEFALQELQSLCRNHPELADYRQQALDVLRPNLTFGELQAMRDWVAIKVQS